MPRGTLYKWITGNNVVVCDNNPSKHEHDVYQWFLDIVLDEGKTFPVAAVNIFHVSPKKLHGDFMMRLIHMWSGSSRVHDDTLYKLDFAPSGFPKTCLKDTTLYLPRNVKNKNELYTKLIVATFNDTEGKGYYGGSYHFFA